MTACLYPDRNGTGAYQAGCRCDQCRGQYRERRREYRRKNPDACRSSVIKSMYGITLEERDAMIESQGHACAICHTRDPGGRKGCTFHIDHCHVTGTIRGMLCSNCNTALGKFQDDPSLLRAAAVYLEKSQCPK